MKSWGWMIIGAYLMLSWQLVLSPSHKVKPSKEFTLVTKTKELSKKVFAYSKEVKKGIELEMSNPVNIAQAKSLTYKPKKPKNVPLKEKVMLDEPKNTFELVTLGEE